MNLRGRAIGIAAVLLCGISAFVPFASAAQVDAIWNVGSGNWNTAANWLPVVVPNNGTGGNTYHVKIDNGGAGNAVVALNQIATIDLLSISANDTLNVNTVQDLRIEIGPIVNDGLISLNSTGSATELLLNASMSLTGAGVLQLNNNSGNRLIGVTGGTPQHLTHAATHTIRGGGTFGADTLTLTNNGLIDANLSNPIFLDLAAGTNVNTGTMQSSGTGGRLEIINTVLDNTAGLLKALDASSVKFSGSTIVGGSLQADPNSVFTGVNSTLQNVTLTGVLRQFNVEDLTYQGTITNNGTITLESAGSSTDIIVPAGGTTFTGPGQITMGNNAQNRIVNAGAAATLVNAAGHTIRGSGNLGFNGVNLTNNGLIEAHQSVAMTMDLAAGPNTNAGTIQGNAAGSLFIQDSVIDNTAGLIRALGTSSVAIRDGSTVDGGQLQADVGAQFTSRHSTLKNITLTGLLRQFNIDDVTYEGTITNNGTISLESAGSSTDIIVPAGGTTFTGPGQITMGNNAQNRIVNAGAAATLVNAAGHTIRGSGNLGFNGVNLTNNGLIEAHQSVAMTIELAAGPNTNAGTIQSNAAGSLFIQDSAIDNTAGLIRALGTSSVAIRDGSTIDGGQLQADPGAQFTSRNSTLKNITLTGLLRQFNIDDVTYEGTITNNGTISLESAGSSTDIIVPAAGVTFTGTGQITMGNNAQNRIVNGGTLSTLVNAAGHTIRGSGDLGFNGVHITNNGTIIADQSTPMVIDTPSDGQGFLNNGTINVVGTTLQIVTGNFTNAGTVNIPAGATLVRTGHYTQTGGTTTVNGTLNPSVSMQLFGGTLKGNGSVISNGQLANDGTIAPGDPIGELFLNKGLAQSPSGIISIEIGGLVQGTEYDLLTIAANTHTIIDGTLKVRFVNGFDPQVGDNFEVMYYSDPVIPGTQHHGDFRFIDAPCNLPGRRVEIFHAQATDFNAGSVTVRIVADGGDIVDTNCDCIYAIPGDILALVQSMLDPAAYDALYPGCTGADVNGDGQRNGKDVQAFVDALLN